MAFSEAATAGGGRGVDEPDLARRLAEEDEGRRAPFGVRDEGAAAQQLGCHVEAPFQLLAFLALSVIPSLKLTDRGLFAQ